MSEKNVASAVAYYKAMNDKNIAGMEKYLHPEVQFIGPLAELKGKQAVLEAAKRFVLLFKNLTIRAQLGAQQQARDGGHRRAAHRGAVARLSRCAQLQVRCRR